MNSELEPMGRIVSVAHVEVISGKMYLRKWQKLHKNLSQARDINPGPLNTKQKI
jgi:hypothetical protein